MYTTPQPGNQYFKYNNQYTLKFGTSRLYGRCFILNSPPPYKHDLLK